MILCKGKESPNARQGEWNLCAWGQGSSFKKQALPASRMERTIARPHANRALKIIFAQDSFSASCVRDISSCRR